MSYNIPPNDIVVEKCILGILIIYPEIREKVFREIKSKHFYNTMSGKMFNVIKQMYYDDKTIDLITVKNYCYKLDKKTHVAAYLANCVNESPTSGAISTHCQILQQYYLLRQYITQSMVLIENSHILPSDFDQHLDKIKTLAGSLNFSNEEKTTVHHISNVMEEVLNEVETASKSSFGITGLSTGIHEYDMLTGGLHKGDLNIIAGSTSMGKTSLALSIVNNLISHGKKGLFFTCEMPNVQLGMRLLSIQSQESLYDLRHGKVKKEGWKKLIIASEKIVKQNLFLCETANLSFSDIKDNMLKTIAKHNIDFVVIDHLQLLQSKEKHKTQTAELTEISRDAKLFPREFNIPLILLSQLSRGIDSRDNPEPKLSDLRGSGTIEQDADNVLFIHTDRTAGESKCWLKKQRNGPLGEFILTFDKNTTGISDKRKDYF